MPVFLTELVCAIIVLAIGAITGWLLRARFSRPVDSTVTSSEDTRGSEVLARLHELAASIATDVGQHSSRVKAISDELAETDDADSAVVMAAVADLVEANKRMQKQLASAEDRMKEQAIELETQTAAALSDGLTGLANRRALDDELAIRLAEHARKATPVCVAMVDIDHFKRFNDMHGHRAGDDVLKRVAGVLADSMRKRDFVARYGGEEFSVVLSETTMEEAAECIERARKAIEAATFHFEGNNLKVQASLGIAQLLDGETANAWVARADEALYAAKQAGRNRCYMHDSQLTRPIEKAQAGPPDGVSVESLSETKQHGEKPVAEGSLDSRTDLNTRTSFCSDLQRRLSEFRRGGSSIALVLLEIDDFEGMTERRGKKFSDTLISATAQFLKIAIRDMDLVARYDVNTFSLMLPTAQLDGAITFAERLRQTTEACKLKIQGHETSYTLSIGVAEALSGEDASEFLVRAEQALEGAVANGRNRTWCHNGSRIEAATGKTVDQNSRNGILPSLSK